jgi:HNH endonuclease/AP2 domain
MTDELWFQIISESFYLPDESGIPWWKTRPSNHFLTQQGASLFNSVYALKPAGTTSRKDGRRAILFRHGSKKIRVLGYQIVWALTHGRKPELQIDHKDQNPTNDKPDNLRLATNVQNQGNSGPPSHNTSGVKGVRWDKKNQNWKAQISIGNKNQHIGCYPSIALAAEAYRAKAIAHFGEDFACFSSKGQS